ncbi:Integrase catalytic domain-containing protein [Citrus sinensis]|nr:Integrase catalytic domain-containing protein [Citrus sinensis]
MKMRAILRKNNCLEAIGERHAEITDDKWNEIDGNAIANLHLALADGVLSSVAKEKTAKSIWDTLTKLYKVKLLHNNIFLKRRLYNLQMVETTTVTNHISTLKTLFSQLTMLGHKIEEIKRAELLLQSLPDLYDQLIINLMNNILTEYLVFNDVAASVLEENSRHKNKEDKLASSQEAEALMMGCVASTSDDGNVLYSEAGMVAESRKQLYDVWLIDSGVTWRCWVDSIKKKSYTFLIFKEYKAQVELEYGKMIKCLRTDNGEEYTDGEFLAYCKNSQDRLLCSESVGIYSDWVETPMEMWTRKPTYYSHLHAFGCHVYLMYNVQERTKLDLKSRRYIFLGYADEVKGYRLWDPIAHKIVIIMDVIFLDVKTAFLHRELEEEIYMLQPEEMKEMSQVPYASALRSLMLAMICTRLDITQVVRVVSRYMANPGREHWKTVNKILRHIRGSSNVALCYGGSKFTVRGYMDSDFAGDLSKRKSTTSYMFTLTGGAISCVSKLQTVVALSTTEVKYMATTQAYKEAIWIQKLLEELGHRQGKILVFCDSQSALHIAKNPAVHSRTKHLAIQYHFVREVVDDGSMDLHKIHTKGNISVVLTMPINANKFLWGRSSYGLIET